jgi:WD40 repeat protein
MSLVVKCQCGKTLQAKDELAGKRVKCPACGGILVVPLPGTPAKADDPLGLGGLDLSDPALGGRTLPPAAPLRPMPSAARAGSGPSSGNVVLWVLLGVGGAICLLIVGVAVLGLLFWVKASPVAVAPPTAVPSPTAPGGPTTGPLSQPAAKDSATPVTKTDALMWQVQADPPKQTLAWPEQPKVDVPIPQGKDRVLFSATPSPFAVVGLNISGGDTVKVWDLVKPQEAGALQEEVKSGDVVALSPDGQYLAAKVTGSQHESTVQLLSFKTGKLVRELQCDDAKVYLQTLDFIASNRLVTQVFGPVGTGYRYAISVWDVTTGNRVCDIPVDATYQRDKLAFSPGGRYLATLAGDKLLAFDLQTGRLSGRRAIQDIVGNATPVLYGMTFSPDGRQLAMAMGATNSRLVLLDFAAGKVAEQIELAGKPPMASAYRGAAIEWLGEKGWCLFGGTIIDRGTRRVVWNLGVSTVFSLTPRRTLPGGWIVATGPYSNTRLRFVPIPWDKIQASLKALASDGAAPLKPGSSVSLDLTIEKLRFGTEADTKTKLAGIFQERFKADGISVADNQPLVLKIAYSESAGETLTERQGVFGPSTGRTVQATKVNVKMVLAARAGGQVVWQQDLAHNPHAVSIMGKEATDASVRDAILQQLLYQLSFSPIPYFVPQDKSLSNLPGVTELGEQ